MVVVVAVVGVVVSVSCLEVAAAAAAAAAALVAEVGVPLPLLLVIPLRGRLRARPRPWRRLRSRRRLRCCCRRSADRLFGSAPRDWSGAAPAKGTVVAVCAGAAGAAAGAAGAAAAESVRRREACVEDGAGEKAAAMAEEDGATLLARARVTNTTAARTPVMNQPGYWRSARASRAAQATASPYKLHTHDTTKHRDAMRTCAHAWHDARVRMCTSLAQPHRTNANECNAHAWDLGLV